MSVPGPQAVGVAFRRAGAIFDFDPAGHRLAIGDEVVVDSEKGLTIGRVVVGAKPAPSPFTPEGMRPRVLRLATEADRQAEAKRLAKGAAGLKVAFRLAMDKKLPLKIVSLEYSAAFDKAWLFFASEERIDFRALVKDLATALDARIEMRQIGARDGAKVAGGLGPCGRELCCSSFLHEFEPVSIKMAKDQGLALNPTKISGMCGRLMCCLSYEHEGYLQNKEGLPKVGKGVSTPKGSGRVLSVEILERRVRVLLQDGTVEMFPGDSVKREIPPPQAPKIRT